MTSLWQTDDVIEKNDVIVYIFCMHSKVKTLNYISEKIFPIWNITLDFMSDQIFHMTSLWKIDDVIKKNDVIIFFLDFFKSQDHNLYLWTFLSHLNHNFRFYKGSKSWGWFNPPPIPECTQKPNINRVNKYCILRASHDSINPHFSRPFTILIRLR